MKNRRMYGVCLLAALLAGACSRGASDAGGEAGAGEEPPAAVPEVTVTKVARADISRMLSLPAVIAAVPNQDVKIGAQVPGRIAELTVAEGDQVTAGQRIARVDEGPLQNELQKAEAAAQQSRANLENAKLSLARNEDLLSRGIAARKEVEDARTANQVAAAAVQQAETEIAAARLQLARAQVQSPLSGIVVKRFVNVGEQVDGTADHPLVEVANLSEVELNASAPPQDVSKLRVGQSIDFASSAFPGKKFSGRVIAISPSVDAASNSAQVRIRVANGDGVLRLGMFLTAEIPIETHAKALVVPPQAIYRDEEGEAHVYRVVGDDSTAVPVELGIETPDHVELLSGVAEGDAVILVGGYGLEDKAKVSVKDAAKDAGKGAEKPADKSADKSGDEGGEKK